jgi:alkaline phosphatase
LKKGIFSKSLLFVLVAIVLLSGLSSIAVEAMSSKPVETKNEVKKIEEVKAPKYVFYFIGDGLGPAQRQLAEYYFKYQSKDQNAKLLMDQFPVAGINTTYSADSLVTDSAAAGTALATGYKTNNGVIAQLPDGTNLKTLAEVAKEKGMATGLVSTTRLTHATPASFATHIDNRNKENEIAAQYVESGVEFLAAGGYRYFVPKGGELKSKRKDDRDLVKEFKNKGYNTFISEADTTQFRSFAPQGKEKVVALFTYSHLPYEIDRDVNKLPSLAEMTEKGIDVLSKYDNGFFMMIEGGRIDHAAHANDPAGMLHDTLAFDRAISKAYKFYQAHPKETLIVVVGDHETGGVGLGFAKNYFLNVDKLAAVKVSTADVLNYGEGKYNGNRDEFFSYIDKNLGLSNLTVQEKAEIVKAMDMVDKGHKASAREYGGYDPVAIATTHVLSERANLQWTTYAHSATSIPLSAVGVGADNFGGYKDNTEIAKTMAKVMEVELAR